MSSIEQAQSQLDALILAGAGACLTGEVLHLWNQVREQQPEAWREMCQWVLEDRAHDFLSALCRQCDPDWGCAVPLHPELKAQVQQLVDALMERWR
ncbi:hypothetical protein [Deinococcus sp. QL22]|uniref:hypothetical protein n=1 Tax=Deinococcus sp. QL22 TaxID=2939437 RepID=UPI0020171D3D|nr:hypothetical protein [Deinococcus sp. QL22]UQN06533.1 hypothetical protein M1R55_01025 [Deinococcus sp. QL22]